MSKPDETKSSQPFDPEALEQTAEKLIREGRMPSLEDFLRAVAEEREKVQKWRECSWHGTRLAFGVIPGGAGTGTLVFIPIERAEQLATIRRAIKTAAFGR